MSLSSIKKQLEKMAQAITWAAILETAGYVRREVERLTSGEMLYEWVYEKNGVLSIIQTWSEDSPGIIMDWEHSGHREISKFEAVLRLRCDGNFALAKTLLMEAVTLGDNAIDKIGRMNWRDYVQSSNEMAPEVLYYTSEVFQAQVDTELSNLISKDFAKAKHEELKFAQEGEPQPSQSLKDFLEKVISASKWLIEGLFPVSGKVFLVAKAKAGKTTLVTALLKALADGGNFLSKFKVSAHEGRIGYMNLELTELQMQEWLQRQNIVNVEKIHVWNLRGKANPFRSESSRRAELCEQTAASLRARSLNVTALTCDVTDEASVNSLVDQVMEKEGKLDVFVANAGGSATTSHPPHGKIDEFRWTLEKNLTSTYMCAQAAGRVMIPQKSGSIITLGSIGSRLASDPRIYNENFKRSGSPYMAAKAGVLMLSRALAAEYSPHGVRVNSICPGQIPNDLTDKDQVETFRNMNAFHRTGLAEDLKGACALLASDAGKWITGTDILVDGGWSIW